MTTLNWKYFFCMTLFAFGQMSAGFTSLDEYGTPLCSDGTAANYQGLAVAGVGISTGGMFAGSVALAGMWVGGSELVLIGDNLELLGADGKLISKFERVATKTVGRAVSSWITPPTEVVAKFGVPTAAQIYSFNKLVNPAESSRCPSDEVHDSPGASLIVNTKLWRQVSPTTVSGR